MAKRWTRGAALFFIGFCAVASVVDLFSMLRPLSLSGQSWSSSSHQLRRALRWSDHHSRPPVNPIIRDHMKPLGRPPDPSMETVMFWHIPKSGGTTLKTIYKCMNQTLAVRVGAAPHLGHNKDTDIVVFELAHTGVNFVNVDVLSRPGILRAEQMGLVPSGKADMIVTTNLNYAVEHLYDDFHKGRILALFRHPVERLVSKFYYSQMATWERSYRPEWKDIDLEYWATHVNGENNFIVKSLANVDKDAPITNLDLRVAERTLRRRFIVGLMDQMEESLHRFNIFMGIDESKKNNLKCMDEFFGHGNKKSNSNSHPKVKEESAAWQTLARDNEYDIRLYESILDIFDEQRAMISSYASDKSVWNGHE